VKLLLDHNADVNISCTDSGATALHNAALNGDVGTVKLLVNKKAKVNARAHDRVTALHISAGKGDAEVVRLLLANNANVNATLTSNGTTALHIAARNGDAEVVKILLDNNANVNAHSRNGEKPIDSARRKHHLDVVHLLQQFLDSVVSSNSDELRK